MIMMMIMMMMQAVHMMMFMMEFLYQSLFLLLVFSIFQTSLLPSYDTIVSAGAFLVTDTFLRPPGNFLLFCITTFWLFLHTASAQVNALILPPLLILQRISFPTSFSSDANIKI